jgi:hypothetical protein
MSLVWQIDTLAVQAAIVAGAVWLALQYDRIAVSVAGLPKSAKVVGSVLLAAAALFAGLNWGAGEHRQLKLVPIDEPAQPKAAEKNPWEKFRRQ